VATLVLIVFISVAGSAGPQAGAPAFEVATIKPSNSTSPPLGMNRTPGQLITSNTSLPFLIRWAYDLDEDLLIGAPKGLDSVGFDIVAKIPAGDLPRRQLQLMMRSLLADRFNLRIHRETRELSSYTLVIDKDGPKLRFVDAGQPVAQTPFRMTDAGRLAGTRVTTTMLAKVLADQLGRPVEDQTGIKQPFDFVLQWRPDTDATAPQDNNDRPSIFTAIREQLGLRLNSRKSAVEAIVIDHVDSRPTAN